MKNKKKYKSENSLSLISNNLLDVKLHEMKILINKIDNWKECIKINNQDNKFVGERITKIDLSHKLNVIDKKAQIQKEVDNINKNDKNNIELKNKIKNAEKEQIKLIDEIIQLDIKK